MIILTKQLLITRPNHDTITHYLCEWSKMIIDLAEKKRYKVHDLKSSNANSYNTILRLDKKKYDFVIFNGHGSSTKVAGHLDETIIESGKNHELLKDKIVYCLSCSSAKILGKVCVKDGTKAFIGYKGDFALMRDGSMTSRPLKDKYANSILRPTNQIPLALIKGHNVGEAITRAKNSYVDEIIKLQSSESEPGAGSLAMALMYNLSHLEKHGEDDEKI